MVTATIIEVDGAEGIIIPREMLDRLGPEVGHVVKLTETPDGFSLTADEDFNRQLAAARKSMERYKGVLQKLAEDD